ncbi:c-type cytochrome [Azohydromonas australica]|uniref:c-type cytochrome n=1 Tax=Azohydromonas australica TaxID=364039 RepID=UPI000406216D|nr:cytochrome c [Azohydromonas australica]
MKAPHRVAALLALAACAFQASAQQADAAAGRTVFQNTCAACHNSAGQGTPGLAPALAGTLGKHADSEDGRRYISQVLLQGLSGRIVSQGQTFMGAMPSQAALSDEQLAAVASYVAKELNGSAAAPFTVEEFAKARSSKPTHKELRELREQLPK